MKLFDYIALTVAVSLTIFSFFSAVSGKSDSLEVVIEVDGESWIYPLDSSINQTITGSIGEIVLIIEDEKVYILESDCNEKICVQSGTIEKQGQWLACLPNRFFVTIRGKKEEGVIDAAAY